MGLMPVSIERTAIEQISTQDINPLETEAFSLDPSTVVVRGEMIALIKIM